MGFLFFSVLMGVIPITSCVYQQCDGPCGCSPVFEVEDFSVTQLSIETLYRSDNNQPIDPERFYFYQTLYTGIWVSGLRPINETSQNFDGISLFVPRALASCSPREAFSLETLAGLKIINKNPLELTPNIYLDEGDDITHLFVATTNFQQEYSIESFAKNKHRFQKDERFYLKFNQEPGAPLQLVFNVIIILDNGVNYEFPGQILKIVSATA